MLSFSKKLIANVESTNEAIDADKTNKLIIVDNYV